MKDKTILEGFGHLTDAVSADQAMLGRGIAMVRTRQDALERLLVGSRFGIIKCIAIQLFSPSLLRRMLQAVHSDEIERFNQARRQAQEQRAPVKPAPAIGIIKP